MRSPNRLRRASGHAPVACLLLLSVVLWAPESAWAQSRSITYTQDIQVRFAGSFGAVLSVLPGSSRTSSVGVHMADGQMQTDDGSQSTIVNLEDGRIVSIDHENETYLVYTMADMEAAMAQMQEMTQEMRAQREEAMAEARAQEEEVRAELEAAAEEARATFQVQVRSEPGNETRNFGSVSARKHFLIVDLEPSEELRAEMEAEEEEGGTMVFLMELWQSPELAEAEREMYEGLTMSPQATAEWQGLAEEAQEMAGGLTPEDSYTELALINPQLGAVALQMQEAAEELEGSTLDSRLFVVFVPDDVQFDREAVLAWEPDTMGDVIQGQLTDAARNRAEQAARSAVRGLTRGLLGRGGGGNNDREEEVRDPVMRPLARISRTVTDLEVGSPPATAFQIPEHYREITLADLTSDAGN
ncbi:MAG: hypothetical protein WEA09_14435 [Gemmatimonadota bacterium]